MRSFFEDFFEKENIFVRGEISEDKLRIINPRRMPDGIKSCIVWLIPYYTGSHSERNVSLYALSKDYHLYAKELCTKLCERAKEEFPDDEFYGFCDNSPINDIAAAVTAGLGVLGKNRLLINEKYGSYVFIGCLLTSLEAHSPKNEEVKHCSGCGRCLESCEFLCGNREYCLSELNQRKVLDDEELSVVKSKKIRWGCDICQEVCPMNKDVPITPIEFFRKDIIENVSAALIEEMPDTDFKERAYSWRGKKTILRNVE